MVRKVRTILIGLGNVNLGLLRILVEKEKEIAKKHLVQFIITGVADSSGFAINDNGFNYQELLSLKSNNRKVKELKGFIGSKTLESIAELAEADLLIESSPVNLQPGNPGLQLVKDALTRGWKVVLANKAPLVLEFDNLMHLARNHDTKIYYSGTVCGGLPVINVLQRDLKVTNLKSLQGIFNATTNFVLDEMEKGNKIEDAIMEAQRIGAAETDPSLDISGQDAANKLFIVMKSFTDFSGTLRDIQMQGIEKVTAEQIAKASQTNSKIKLIASAQKVNDNWILSVKPTLVARDSFLGSCNGWEMGIEIKTDLYDSISMKHYEADPTGTSAAVLRDAIDISQR